MDPYAWSWNPEALVVVLLTVAYVAAIRTRYPASPWRVASFAVAMVLLLAVSVSPLHMLAMQFLLTVHLYYFTFASLSRMLESTGFSVVRLTYTNAALFLPLLIARTLQRHRGLRPESDAEQEIAVPPAPINAALSAVMWAESLWLRAFDAPFGSSLLCLARRPLA